VFGATKVAADVLCVLKLPLDALHVTPALPTSFVTVAVNGIACESVNPPRLGLIVTLMLPDEAACVVAVAVFEYALLFPAASSARTRYEYEVEAANPVSLNVVPDGVAICAKFAHAAPEQRSTLYPATPTLSVEAVQVRLICEVEAAVAARLVGAVGGVMSGAAGVVAVAVFEYALLFPAASSARTRYEYEVEAANPVSLNVVLDGVAICAKFAQATPEQRSTLYPATPTLSVEAVHDKLICEAASAAAARFAGAVGGVVSGAVGVVAVTVFEYALLFPAASSARTR
jgi:hypothetical protein